MDPWRRLRLGLLLLGGVLVAGTVGYVILGFPLLDAVYQTVTTVTTVGFREVQPLSDTGQVFTIVLILTGVGTALYNLTLVIQAVIEGELAELLGRRKMERHIGRMGNHVIVCGWGRVGKALT
ncbi:MAG: ion channel, partial [Acidimicrobiia bacterium]